MDIYEDNPVYQSPNIEYVLRIHGVLCGSPSGIEGWMRTGDDSDNEGEEW